MTCSHSNSVICSNSGCSSCSYEDAPWKARVWTSYAGWRPSEALTLSTVAFHQTLSELLLFLARSAVRDSAALKRVAGLKLDMEDVKDLSRLNACCALSDIPDIVGFTAEGLPNDTAMHDSLKRQGRRWALHILEGPYSWCLSAAYICVTVIWGHPVFLSIAHSVHRAIEGEEKKDIELPERVKYVMLALDAVLYSFLPLFFSLVLRLVQGRELLARLGKRTLVIADVPYVHQLLEAYVSKLFALSYSIASIDVHGANAVDHLVHRFTHRIYRGTLVAVGRTDGRLFSQSKGVYICVCLLRIWCTEPLIS